MKNHALRAFAVALLFISIGCTRPEVSISKITIKTPTLDQGNSGQGVALPANKKVCYGVNVSGPGIPESTVSPSCFVKVSAFSGWVAEGSELIVEVQKGRNRKFDLYVYLADSGETCPGFSVSQLTGVDGARVVPSGSTPGVTVNADNQVVKIDLDFPGALAAVGPSCSSQAGLKAKLYTNGDLVDAVTGASLGETSPTTEFGYKSPLTDPLQLGIISSGGVLNLASNAIEVPQYVFSVTRKPDTGEFFGLMHDGQIVKLTGTGSFTAEVLTSLNCPFRLLDCKTPVWLQSISAGYGQELYGLDHGGQIFSLKPSGITSVGISVEPNVSQVSFY